MTSQPNAKKKILVIDDEENIVKYMEALLQDNGYDTVAAYNGNQGLEKARSEKPDLICLDITMPEKSGIRFYRELKEDAAIAEIPVVVVTAVTGYGGDPEPFRQFLSNRPQFPPPAEFISKPIDREVFLEVIARVLGGE